MVLFFLVKISFYSKNPKTFTSDLFFSQVLEQCNVELNTEEENRTKFGHGGGIVFFVHKLDYKQKAIDLFFKIGGQK